MHTTDNLNEVRLSPVRSGVGAPQPAPGPPVFRHRCAGVAEWAEAAGYEYRGPVGRGAFSAVEHWERVSDGLGVAVKSIRLAPPFDVERAYQVKVLRQLSRCRRVVRLIEIHEVHLRLEPVSLSSSTATSARSSASAGAPPARDAEGSPASGGGAGGAWTGEDPFASETRLLTAHAKAASPEACAADAMDDGAYLSLGFLVFELSPASLREWVLSFGQRFTTREARLAAIGYVETVRHFMYELLCALDEVHRSGFAHCDIKPGNVLVDPRAHPAVLRLADFGMAMDRPLLADRSGVLCTAQYRAPELLLGAVEFTTAVDVWSAGCVLVEMLGGSMLFDPDGPHFAAPGEPDPARWDAARYPPPPRHWEHLQPPRRHMRDMRVLHTVLTFTGSELPMTLAAGCGVDTRACFGEYAAKNPACLLPAGAPDWALEVLGRSLRLDPSARYDAARLALRLRGPPV
jgi:serine/threonine protein kinase